MRPSRLLAAALVASSLTAPAAGGGISLSDGLGHEVLNESELATQRGKQGLTIDNEQTATLENNVLESAPTGANAIGNGAFTGATGITTVIQNSGNQVIIQDSTNVNLMFR